MKNIQLLLLKAPVGMADARNGSITKTYFTMDLINNSKCDDSFANLGTKAVILGASSAFVIVLVLGLLSV